jgi:hypothetical protein
MLDFLAKGGVLLNFVEKLDERGEIVCQWSRIDCAAQGHRFLDPEDICWYVGDVDDDDNVEFYLGLLKLPPWRKNFELRQCGESGFGDYLSNLLNYRYANMTVALVPMPSSKAKTDPAYSNSLIMACRRAAADCHWQVDVVEALITPVTTCSSHKSKEKRDIGKASSAQCVWLGLGLERYDAVIVVDDVLSSGAHFKAAQGYLKGAYGITAHGAFLARTPRRYVEAKKTNYKVPATDKEQATSERPKGIVRRLASWFINLVRWH